MKIQNLQLYTLDLPIASCDIRAKNKTFIVKNTKNKQKYCVKMLKKTYIKKKY